MPSPTTSSLASFLANHTLRTVNIGDQQWQVLRSGQGDQSVLLLPGGAGRAEAEHQLVTRLEAHIEVVAVSYPPVPTLHALLDGLVGILEAEGLTRVVVWGNSFGGMVAQALVRRLRHPVEALVLGHTAVPDRARARKAAAQQRVLAALPAPVVRVLTRLAFARLLRTLPAAERTAWREFLDRDFLPHAKSRMVSLSAIAKDFYSEDLEPWPGRALILDAPEDALYGAMSTGLRRLYPAAAVHTSTDGGHVSDAARSALKHRPSSDSSTHTVIPRSRAMRRETTWSHAGHGQALEDLDRSAHRRVRVPVEHLSEGIGVSGLQERVATDGVAGIAARLDHVEWGAEVDDGVAGPLSPRHPGIHPSLGLLGRARSHLLRCSRLRTVEHEELRHRRSSRRVLVPCSADTYLGNGLNNRVAW
jgi:pimeloyl-ACP methyl ester carboxylesterase